MSSNERDDVQIDHPRRARTGIPEVVFGAGKTREQIEYIMRELYREHGFAFATRVSPSAGAQLAGALAQASYDERARTLRCGALARTGLLIGVACAGTSDVAVAEEAALTLDAFGHDVLRRYDVGVAGLHRALAEARVIICVAGMEGALPSVIAGLVRRPIVAVPTSVGYGASFGGIAALLAMLNSCAPGVAVVNIDNGFGGAAMAHKIATSH